MRVDASTVATLLRDCCCLLQICSNIKANFLLHIYYNIVPNIIWTHDLIWHNQVIYPIDPTYNLNIYIENVEYPCIYQYKDQYVSIHLHIHLCVHVSIYKYVKIYVYMYICIHIQADMQQTWTYTGEYTCVWLFTCEYTSNMYIYRRNCIYIYIYIQIYMKKCIVRWICMYGCIYMWIQVNIS
jgi:hypothetical protein